MPRRLFILSFILAALIGAGFFVAFQKNEFSFSFESFKDFVSQKIVGWLPEEQKQEKDFSVLWLSDFRGNRILGLSPDDKIIWEQNMAAEPIPWQSYNVHSEYVTVAPNGNLIVADGDGMMVQEIDRKTHQLLWQYGVRNKQGATNGLIHQPDKSFKINDHEVLINDGNNRRVIIIDQKTNQIVWQYGHTLEMGSAPGWLHGNTNARPLGGDKQILITDTLENKIMIIERLTKEILWEYRKPDAKWLQHVFPTSEGTFILEDRQKNEVFEINRQGEILWTLNKLADGSGLISPMDTIKLRDGHVLIAEAGRSRVIEIVPETGEIVRQWGNGKTSPFLGLVTTIALDEGEPPISQIPKISPKISFIGPRGNTSTTTPNDYGFWSFAVVVPGVISRSGQPTIEDFKWLKENGWKSVVNLRVDGERNEVGDDEKIPGFNNLGFNYLWLPIADGSPLTEEQAQKFLAFITNPANWPVHVHCRGGIGRGGTMIALYRYAVQAWPIDKAIEESRLFQGGVSDSQKNWLENWAQNHKPGSDKK